MANWIYVNMPIKCVGKMCENCQYLNIDSDVTKLYGNGEQVGVSVDLACRSVNRCVRLLTMMEEEHDKCTGQNP